MRKTLFAVILTICTLVGATSTTGLLKEQVMVAVVQPEIISAMELRIITI